MKEFTLGFFTGLSLQLAIGPVFLFIANLALQKSVIDGFAGVLAVTIVDLGYIGLVIFGIGRILEDPRWKKSFPLFSSFILIALGVLIFRSVFDNGTGVFAIAAGSDLLASFTSVFLLTVFNPMTIVLFTGLLAIKAVENNYTRKQLAVFGLGAGMATFAFMGMAVIFFSSIRGFIPLIAMQGLNIAVSLLLVGYGIRGLFRTLTAGNPEQPGPG